MNRATNVRNSLDRAAKRTFRRARGMPWSLARKAGEAWLVAMWPWTWGKPDEGAGNARAPVKKRSKAERRLQRARAVSGIDAMLAESRIRRHTFGGDANA